MKKKITKNLNSYTSIFLYTGVCLLIFYLFGWNSLSLKILGFSIIISLLVFLFIFFTNKEHLLNKYNDSNKKTRIALVYSSRFAFSLFIIGFSIYSVFCSIYAPIIHQYSTVEFNPINIFSALQYFNNQPIKNKKNNVYILKKETTTNQKYNFLFLLDNTPSCDLEENLTNISPYINKLQDVESISFKDNKFTRRSAQEQKQIVFAKSLIEIKKELISVIGLEGTSNEVEYLNNVSTGTLITLFFIKSLDKYSSPDITNIGIGSIGYEFAPIYPDEVSSNGAWIQWDDKKHLSVRKKVKTKVKSIKKETKRGKNREYTNFKENFDRIIAHYLSNNSNFDRKNATLIITIISDLDHDEKAIEINSIEAELKKMAEVGGNIELNIIKIPNFSQSQQSKKQLLSIFEKYFSYTPYTNEGLLDIATFQEENYVDHLESIFAPTKKIEDILYFDYIKNSDEVSAKIDFKNFIQEAQDLVLRIKPISKNDNSNYQVRYKSENGPSNSPKGVLYPGISESLEKIYASHTLEISVKNFSSYDLPRFALEFWTKPSQGQNEAKKAKFKYLIKTKFRERLNDNLFSSILFITLITVCFLFSTLFLFSTQFLLKKSIKMAQKVSEEDNGQIQNNEELPPLDKISSEVENNGLQNNGNNRVNLINEDKLKTNSNNDV